MLEPRHKEHIDVQNTTTYTQTGLRPVVIVNGPTARDFLAFSDQIFLQSLGQTGPSASQAHRCMEHADPSDWAFDLKYNEYKKLMACVFMFFFSNIDLKPHFLIYTICFHRNVILSELNFHVALNSCLCVPHTFIGCGLGTTIRPIKEFFYGLSGIFGKCFMTLLTFLFDGSLHGT